MKHLMKMLLPVTAIFLLTACGSNEANNENVKGTDSVVREEMPLGQNGKAIINNGDLNAVYEQYAKLTDAFTKGDIANAKLAANAIEVGAKELDGGQAIASSAATIVGADDIEVQRTAYLKMSTDLIALVKSSGMKEGELYVEHCPMAFNNAGGSWISSNKEIRNPYFGDKMMTCGEVTETIK
jgi:hypothetical protein